MKEGRKEGKKEGRKNRREEDRKIESNNNSDNVLDLSSQNTLRALIRNVLIVIKEILNQNENK